MYRTICTSSGQATAGAQSDRPKKTPRKRKVKAAADGSENADTNGTGGDSTNGPANGDDSPTPKKRGRKTKAEKEREAANQNNASVNTNGKDRNNNTSDEENIMKDSGIGSSVGSSSSDTDKAGTTVGVPAQPIRKAQRVGLLGTSSK